MTSGNEVDAFRLRQSLENGECLRCGHIFKQKRLFCPKCSSPNFLAKPTISVVITVLPFVLICIFFLASYVLWKGEDDVEKIAKYGVIASIIMAALALALAIWTLRSSATIRRVRRNSLLKLMEAEKESDFNG